MASADCLGVLRDVCAAVDAAHRQRLVHRDLKPENIFLVRGGNERITKVLDFGLAKVLSSTDSAATTQSGPVAGTLLYMAPEQVQAQPVDAAWDVWALAVVAYEMLTGTHPFAYENFSERLNAVLTGRFIPVGAGLPEAPTHWNEFFTRAFSMDPVERPRSAKAFQSELEHTLRIDHRKPA